MGNGHAVSETIKKNQEYIQDMNRQKMERWIQMHYQIAERERALELSRSRELFYWLGSFSAVTFSVIFNRFQRTRQPALLYPVVPMAFGLAYYADLAYGSKLHRIRAEAEMILQHESELLEWPCGLPTVSSIDTAREDSEMEKKLHPVVP